MTRIANIAAPGMPHHITQRGNRRQQTFFSDEDYIAYIDLMAEWCRMYEVDIWSYCLLPNHLHLIAVPSEKESLMLAIGKAHGRYTRLINYSKVRKGDLCFIHIGWALSAGLCPGYWDDSDKGYKLVEHPQEWAWSSTAAHIENKNDKLLLVDSLMSIVKKTGQRF